MSDPVNHPRHYTHHESGIECIEITQSLPFCIGNAFKYITRADHKGNMLQDLEKAAWYLKRIFSHNLKPHQYPSTDERALIIKYFSYEDDEVSTALKTYLLSPTENSLIVLLSTLNTVIVDLKSFHE